MWLKIILGIVLFTIVSRTIFSHFKYLPKKIRIMVFSLFKYIRTWYSVLKLQAFDVRIVNRMEKKTETKCLKQYFINTKFS